MTKVLVIHRVEMVYDMPDDWCDKHAVEFWLNDGTRCQNNLTDDLEELKKRLDPDSEGYDCLCHLVESEYVREANGDDLERHGFIQEGLTDGHHDQH